MIFEQQIRDPLFRITLIGAWLGFVATIYFIFGLAGFVGSAWLNLFMAASVAAAVLAFVVLGGATLRQANGLGRAVGAVVVALLAAEILLSLVPPTARDELTHHLAIPRLYTRAGRIIEVSMAPYSYYPMLLEMLYTPWVYWSYDSIPKLIHCLYGFLTGLALCVYLSRRMNVVYGLLGFFFFVSIPVVLRLDHSAYVDLGITFYATVSLLCLIRWREDQTATSWLLLAALSLGFTAATKPNGLLVVLILSWLMVLTLVHDPPTLRIARPIFLFAATAALPFLPWLVKNWMQTGNPFFPLLSGVFPGKSGPGASPSVSFGGLAILAKRQLLYGESRWQIAALPLRVFFSGRDDSPRYFDGALSPILLLFLPWAFKGKWLDEKKILATFAVLYFAFALFLADLRVRYLLPIVPPLVALLVYGVFNVYLRINRPIYLFAVILFFAALPAVYLWRYFEAAQPMAYLTGRESRETYLTRMLPEYPAFAYINRELPATAKIYLLFIGRRAYYCERDYVHDGGELPGLLVSAIQSARDSSAIGKSLKQQGITDLMVREDLLVRFLDNNLSRSQQILWNNFVSEQLRPEFRSRGYALYQVDG